MGSVAVLLSAACLTAAPASAAGGPPKMGGVPLSNGDLRAAVAADRADEPIPLHLPSTKGGTLVVEVLFRDGEGAAAREAVAHVGGDPGTTIAGELIQADVPLDGLVELEGRGVITSVRPPPEPPVPADAPLPDPTAIVVPDSVRGDEIYKTNADLWQAAGFTGAGVKVGVVDYFQGSTYAAAQAAGDVPAPAGTFCRNNGAACDVYTGTEIHGVASVEGVHDMAPDAEIYLARVSTTADLQQAVNYFAANGVDIMTRSLGGQYDGRGDGTGPAGAVVDSAVAQGIAFFQSAGNNGGRYGGIGTYWRGPWADADLDDVLDFAPGDETLDFDCRHIDGLRWNDWGTNRTDYDLILYTAGGVFLDSSLDNQQGTAPPLELSATSCGSPGAPVYAKVTRPIAGNGSVGDILEFSTDGLAVQGATNPFSAAIPIGDSQSPGEITVGAIEPALGFDIAEYSSEGPTNAGTLKPDLSAASCYLAFAYPNSCYRGTSAAAPVAAGAGALILSSGRASTPAQLKQYMIGQATADRGVPGPDNVYGYGEVVLGDVTPPSVRAFKGKAKKGKTAALRYLVLDDSGATQDVVEILRKGKTKATTTTPLGSDGDHTVKTKVPRGSTKGLSFCVTATDAVGLSSQRACAKLKVKKKKRR